MVGSAMPRHIPLSIALAAVIGSMTWINPRFLGILHPAMRVKKWTALRLCQSIVTGLRSHVPVLDGAIMSCNPPIVSTCLSDAKTSRCAIPGQLSGCLFIPPTNTAYTRCLPSNSRDLPPRSHLASSNFMPCFRLIWTVVHARVLQNRA